MAEKKPATNATRESTKSASPRETSANVFTEEERAAMREHAREVKAALRGEAVDEESNVLAKIAAMSAADRAMGERLHAIIRNAAPELKPRLWYGMPAYARDGKVVCFFQNADKFKSRYGTLGFSDRANLDEDHVWPTSFAVKDLTAADEARIVALVKKAVS